MSSQDAPCVSDGHKIAWSNEFSVGIERLDQQHKHLISLINKLLDHRHDSVHSDAVSSIFGGLINYVQQHFTHEEELMEQHGFPGLANHRSNHIRFTEELIDMVHHSDSLGAEELLRYLQEWFSTHLLHDDQDYAKFFAEVGVS